jgi:type IV conjugative transfer system protein TraL
MSHLNFSANIYADLDSPKRYLMFECDEIMGMGLGVMVGAFLFHGGIAMFMTAFGALIGVRSMKKKRPPQFWLHLMYAYLPRFVSRLWFHHFPDYANQHFLT